MHAAAAAVARTRRPQATNQTAASAASTAAVPYMVHELGSRGMSRYPMAAVPTRLPTVLRAESRPTVPPTSRSERVTTRARKGPVMASRPRGTKNRNTEARSEPAASGRPSSA